MPERWERFTLSRGRVALLGIAGRTSHATFAVKLRKEWRHKPLPVKIKAIGDLIQIKRRAKNLTFGHLASKMGIAAGVVCTWEDGSAAPNDHQLEQLAAVLGFDPKNPSPSSRGQLMKASITTARDPYWGRRVRSAS